MELTESNTYIVEHGELFSLHIEMPDGSRNYLHANFGSLQDAIIVRELIDEKSIDHMNLNIIRDERYYRLILNLKDDNDDFHKFHSRKLNLNDVVFERMQLLTAE